MALAAARLVRFHVSRSDQQHQASKITDADFFRFEVTATLRCISTNLSVIDTSTFFQSIALISCKSFFIRRNQDLPNEDEDLSNEVSLQRFLIPRPWSLETFRGECLDGVSMRIIPQVQQLFDYDPSFIRPPGSERQMFPLTLEMVLDVPPDEEDEEMEPSDEENQEMDLIDEEIQQLEEESMQSVRMVPASENAINSLKKFKVMKQNEHCTICTEEFYLSANNDDDVAASAMPCNHVFHQQCIVQWLQTSHMCPLCRYPMPTANN